MNKKRYSYLLFFLTVVIALQSKMLGDLIHDNMSSKAEGVVLVFTALAILFGYIYFEMLSSSDPTSQSHKDYVAFRRQLVQGGGPTLIYKGWLVVLLSHVDRYFNDYGRRDRSLVSRLLKLDTEGPRWTAQAYDRCLQLALLYPILSVYIVWVFSGHTGIVEHTLGLLRHDINDRFSFLQRVFVAVAICIHIFVTKKWADAEDTWSNAIWSTLAFSTLSVAALAAWLLADPNTGTAAICFVFGFASAFSGVIAFDVAGVVALSSALCLATGVAAGGSMGEFVKNLSFTFNIFAILAVLFVIMISFLLFQHIISFVRKRGYLGPMLCFVTFAMIALCFLAAGVLSGSGTWSEAGSLILFYGLLTLINAPVDWFALGLTRALLRKGLEMGGAWTFAFAVLDIIVALALVAALGVSMVLAIDLFNDLALMRGGPSARILPLDQLFKSLEEAPIAYENWWVWMLLFSSMIPSFSNLVIACASLTRGIPKLNQWILTHLPENSEVSEKYKLPITVILTIQTASGIALSVLMIYGLTAYAMPFVVPNFGAVVRDFAHSLANYNAPERLIEWVKRS